MWLFTIIGVGIVVLAHTAPTRFLLDAMAGDRADWSMPRDEPPTVYCAILALARWASGPRPARGVRERTLC